MKLLIIRYLEGKASREEQAELLDWLRKATNREEFRRVSSEWEAGKLGSEVSPAHMRSWANLQSVLLRQSVRQANRHISVRRAISYAALLLLLISLPFIVQTLRKATPESDLAYNVVMADEDRITRVTLPDHSEVWLNAGSSVRYNNLFAKENRDIALEGEAFFQAAHNRSLPMNVYCSGLKVTVVGTRFNVSSHPGLDDIRVVLEEGVISLSGSGKSGVSVTLKPGDLAIYTKNEGEIMVKQVNPAHYTAWKEGGLIIQDQTLEKLAELLAERYDQKFELDESVKPLKYTFTIKDESLEEVLSLLSLINPVEPVMKNDIIYLRYNLTKAAEINKNK